MSTRVIKEGNVTTEITDMTGGIGGSMTADELMAKMGGRAGTFTEVKPDGTVVTYEMEVEEFTEEVIIMKIKATMLMAGAVVAAAASSHNTMELARIWSSLKYFDLNK